MDYDLTTPEASRGAAAHYEKPGPHMLPAQSQSDMEQEDRENHEDVSMAPPDGEIYFPLPYIPPASLISSSGNMSQLTLGDGPGPMSSPPLLHTPPTHEIPVLAYGVYGYNAMAPPEPPVHQYPPHFHPYRGKCALLTPVAAFVHGDGGICSVLLLTCCRSRISITSISILSRTNFATLINITTWLIPFSPPCYPLALPAYSRLALHRLACLGNRFNVRYIASTRHMVVQPPSCSWISRLARISVQRHAIEQHSRSATSLRQPSRTSERRAGYVCEYADAFTLYSVLWSS